MVLPQQYAPNNDLILVADHGSIEITNVHPGSTVYKTLRLSVNWVSYEPSLISINVHPGPRVSGITGIITWPGHSSVCHHEIEKNVQIVLDENVSEAKITVTDLTGSESEYVMSNSVINVPQADLLNAEERRLKLTLTTNNKSSYILFLPQVESEEFSIDEAIRNDGSFHPTTDYKRTNLIPIQYVMDIVYTGTTYSNVCALVAYNDDDEFVKVLIEDSFVGTAHIEPDGTYTKVAACSYPTATHSLQLHFENVPES